jgi:hypothetical protein
MIRLKKPKVITLCGSTKFKDQYIEAQRGITLAGHIVISVGLFGHADAELLTAEVKEMLDELHFRKIDLSDEIFVINVGGYIGKSTNREIAYAVATGKKVVFLENQDWGVEAK